MAPSEEVLYRSNQLSRWSFSADAFLGPTPAPPTSKQPLPLLDVQGIESWNATSWVIALNTWVYKDGNVGTPPAIGNPLFSQSNGIYSQAYPFVVVDFGIDGLTETVMVDWPARGCTFQVNAAYLRMGVVWRNDFLFAAPRFTGSVAPGRRLNPLWCSPRWTDIRTFGSNTSNVVQVPPRAMGYRVNTQLGTAGGEFTVTQLAAAGAGTTTPYQVDGRFPMDNTIVLIGNDRINHQAYIPIANATQYLQVDVNTLGGSQFNLEYLLDLG